MTAKNERRSGLRRKRGGGLVSGRQSLLPAARPEGKFGSGGENSASSVVFSKAQPSAPFGIKPSRPRDHNTTQQQQAVGPRTRSLLKVQAGEQPDQQGGQAQTQTQAQTQAQAQAAVQGTDAEQQMFQAMHEFQQDNNYDDSAEPLSDWQLMDQEEQLRLFQMEQREKDEQQKLHPLLLHPPPDSLFEKLSRDPKWNLQSLQDNGFIYLAARPSEVASVHPNSFDLVIMSHRKIKETDPRVFFVLSKDGVTMYTYDVPEYKLQQQARKPQPLHMISTPDVEYMTLDDFEQAYEYHKHIVQIPFFRLYRKWKSLRTWRSAVRGKKMRAVRTSLKKKLFLLDPVLRRSLLTIRLYVAKVCHYKLFRVDMEDDQAPQKLEEFQLRQVQQRNEVRGSLEKFQNQVRKVVIETCDASLDSFLVESGFGHDENPDSDNDEDY